MEAEKIDTRHHAALAEQYGTDTVTIQKLLGKVEDTWKGHGSYWADFQNGGAGCSLGCEGDGNCPRTWLQLAENFLKCCAASHQDTMEDGLEILILFTPLAAEDDE